MGQIPSKKGNEKIFTEPRRKKMSVAEVVRLTPPNSSVFIEPGKYEETTPIVIDKSLVLIGLTEDNSTNIVVRTESSCCVMISTSEKVVIQNIEFTTNETLKPVIDIQQGEVIIEDCSISGCEEGVLLSQQATSLTMMNCNVSNCAKVGIECTGEETTIFIDKSNFKECSNAISISQGSNPLINECLISECGTGIYVAENGRVS